MAGLKSFFSAFFWVNLLMVLPLFLVSGMVNAHRQLWNADDGFWTLVQRWYLDFWQMGLACGAFAGLCVGLAHMGTRPR